MSAVKSPRTRVATYLDDAQHAALTELARAYGVSHSEVLRRALSMLVERVTSELDEGKEAATWFERLVRWARCTFRFVGGLR